jgi:leader peptidase (prepilin peptidase)/N-methyltransferase
MPADADAVRRIDVGDGLYVASRPPAAARAWSVHPVAAGLGAALALVALLRLGVTPEGILAAGVLAVLAVLSAIDLRWRLLPNKIVLPATAAVLAWQIAFFPGRAPEWILAALGAGALLLIPALLKPGGLGMGDVKLAALLGAALGAAVLNALTLGFLALVPVAVVLLVRHGTAARRATLPLGPFLAFGAAVVLLA